MNVALPSPRQFSPWHVLTRGLAGLFIAFLLAWIARPAHAAPPPAGTSISNQASATYSDASGVARTVTSNLVQTTVTQVYSLTLTANGAQNATPGSVVYYPHTLTNTGNGTDTFNLGAVTAATQFTMTNVQIFADNGSGTPTGSAITTSGPLASGASFKFIVTGTVPTTATSAQTNVVTASATSAGDATKTASNADTTTVTANAVVTLTKSISVSSGAPGSGPFTYKLTYTNTGNSDATNVAITDVVPAGMTYQAGNSRWSVTGSTALVDTQAGGSVGTSPNTLTSSFNTTTKTLVATIAKVSPGQSGFITFDVTVDAATPPGTLNNTATTSYNNGVTTVTGSSNTVPFSVSQTYSVTLTGATVAGPAAPGSTVSFTNVVKNTGNGTDKFNIVFAATNSFPAGTSFQLYKSDGATPLVDTNGDGALDTGPLAAGASYNVIVKATLPPNAGGTGPFAIVKTAISVADATKTASATDSLTAITSASVDLAHTTAATGLGIGPGAEATAQVTKSTNPATSTTFTLVVKNTGSSPDSYNLVASTVSDFSAITLPAGWTVDFKADASAGACTTTGATITNTGNVAASGNTTVCAVVTVPAGFSAGTSDLYFRALSPTSTAGDGLHDAVTVNAVRSMSITPNGTGQTYPGGSYVYTHTLTNNGNVTEGSTLSTLTPALVNDGSGWTSTFYVDTNGNGTLDAADTLITGSLNAALGSGLLKGASVTVFNKVIAPSGAVAGTVNVTTITVTTANGSYTTTAPTAAVSTDSTTVIAGNLTLIKEQALDATCDGTPDAAYGQGNLNAKPNQCVLYRITVTNVGAADATKVVVSDATPSYTTISTVATTAAPGQIAAGAPTVGNSGTITANMGTGATATLGGTLAAGQSAVITFGVRITP